MPSYLWLCDFRLAENELSERPFSCELLCGSATSWSDHLQKQKLAPGGVCWACHQCMETCMSTRHGPNAAVLTSGIADLSQTLCGHSCLLQHQQGKNNTCISEKREQERMSNSIRYSDKIIFCITSRARQLRGHCEGHCRICSRTDYRVYSCSELAWVTQPMCFPALQQEQCTGLICGPLGLFPRKICWLFNEL